MKKTKIKTILIFVFLTSGYLAIQLCGNQFLQQFAFSLTFGWCLGTIICKQKDKIHREKIGELVGELIASTNRKGELQYQLTEHVRKQKDQAYSERNKILAAFVWHLFRRGLPNVEVGRALHPESDTNWEKDWRNIIVIIGAGVQMTWHIHDSELPLFKGLHYLHDHKWDGHTTDEKYTRLLKFFV